MDIHFCDLCNESVPQSDLDIGRAYVRRGRVVCAKCERAMTHAESSGSHLHEASGGVALQTEIATALGALTENQGEIAKPEPLLAGVGGDLSLSSLADEAHANVPAALPTPVGSGAATAASAQGATSAPGRSSGLALAMVALVFAAGAVAVLNEQMGGIGDRARALEGLMRTQDATLRDLQRTSNQTRDAIAGLEARITEGLGSERDLAEKSLSDLRAQNENVRKAGIELGQRIDELNQAALARGQDLDRRADELSHRLAKSEDDGRVLQERLAKVEELAQRAPVPTAAPSAPTASRWGALVADLQSPKAAARWEAVDQIGQSGDPEALPYLLPMLRDTDVFVRMATARVLGDLKALTAVPALIDSLEDTEPAVREAALGSLRALTSKDLRFDPMGSEGDRAKKVKAWRDWWKKTEEEGGIGKSQG